MSILAWLHADEPASLPVVPSCVNERSLLTAPVDSDSPDARTSHPADKTMPRPAVRNDEAETDRMDKGPTQRALGAAENGSGSGIRWGAAAMPLAMTFFAIALVWLSIGLHLRQERAQYELAAEQDSRNLARGFGENINRMVEGVEQVLKLVRASYTNPR